MVGGKRASGELTDELKRIWDRFRTGGGKNQPGKCRQGPSEEAAPNPVEGDSGGWRGAGAPPTTGAVLAPTQAHDSIPQLSYHAGTLGLGESGDEQP